MPACNGRPHCYAFHWTNMAIQHVSYNGKWTKVSNVDAFVTFTI